MKKDCKNQTRTKKYPQKKEPEKIDYHEFSDSCFSKSICSAGDCTGLIPALPSSQAELDAYEEMYQFCLAGVPAGEEKTLKR